MKGISETRENKMRSGLFVICATLALTSASAPALAQQATGKNCRMEQQCHWENFKKICVWVKVCR